MSVALILAPVCGAKQDEVVLATAFAAARPFHAHVQAIFARPDPGHTLPAGEMMFSRGAIQSFIDAQEELTRESVRSARATLATEAEKFHVTIISNPERTQAATVSYREKAGRLARCLEVASRLCDLIVFPALPAGDPDLRDILQGLLARCGRPILVCPEIAPNQIGTRITIGWDGSMPAAHALTFALPYLRKAKSVNILSVNASSGMVDVNDAKHYLALYGIGASCSTVEAGSKNVSECLLDTATSGGCDLLVMGGYGHSRLRETIFGGVTQYVLSHPRLPVLMAH